MLMVLALRQCEIRLIASLQLGDVGNKEDCSIGYYYKQQFKYEHGITDVL